MRTLAAAMVLCTSCFPWDESSEYVRVTVPVYEGPAHVTVTPRESVAPGARVYPSSADPCDAPAPDIATCTPIGTVRLHDLDQDPRCYYDTKVTDGEIGGVLQCPNGRALAVFDHAIFAGEAQGGYLDVCQTTTYDFPQGDDCRWRTEQRIHGTLSGPMSFSYVESPVGWPADGDGRACTLACRAHATLDVVR
jgi:hypothetical protein